MCRESEEHYLFSVIDETLPSVSDLSIVFSDILLTTCVVLFVSGKCRILELYENKDLAVC